jgi:tRNA modification GTPase
MEQGDDHNKIFAAVMTPNRAGAIATIEITGPGSRDVLRGIINSPEKLTELYNSGILLTNITDGDTIVDQVTIGCEGADLFAVHCHGNSLIIADIIKLLGGRGVKIITSQKMREILLAKVSGRNCIEIESKLYLSSSMSLAGSKIIAYQQSEGLSATAKQWLEDIETIELSELKQQAEGILEVSRVFRLLIEGCKTVLVGPANSGKSTLFNRLIGKDKALVTEIEGTTRDYVTANCRLGEFTLILYDTAGLSRNLNSDIDITSQKISKDILKDADLVLVVFDQNKSEYRLDEQTRELIRGKKTITVLNKLDLPAGLDVDQIAKPKLEICAQDGIGIAELNETIVSVLGLADVNLRQSACFTVRQSKLLGEILEADTKDGAVSAISRLLNDKISV